MYRSIVLLAVLLASAAAGCQKSPLYVARTGEISDAPPSVEVMHWLTSQRDAAALAVVRDSLVKQGGTWRDTPMPGAGTTGRTAAVGRIVGGQPPDVFQFSLGSELAELAARHLVAPVPGNTADWRSIYPAVIDAATRYEGRPFAIPMAVHGENWLFYNVAMLRDASLEVPHDWPELLRAAAKLKAAGKIPLALGGQPWQERLLFNAVLLGVGGRSLYRQVYERLDPNALDSERMLEVFQTFGALRADVDSGSPGRRWTHTTLLLTHGAAAFQIMGDWAKSEILDAGLEPGQEIGCVLAPAKDVAYIMMVDVFAFSRTSEPAAQRGQLLFAQTLEDRGVQVEIAHRLGTIAARTDLSDEGFDPCSMRAMAVIRDPEAQLMDPGLILPGGLAGAIDDSVSRFWNDKSMSPVQGRALLRDAFLAYR